MNSQVIEVIDGEKFVDDRGGVFFINNFMLGEYKRFYIVQNHSNNFVRAWHGHKREAKAVTVLSGTAMIACVKVDNWDNPSKKLEINKFVLTSSNPKIVKIPEGYANGFKTLEHGTKVCFFSSSSLEDSKNDDFRFAYDYWNPWAIEFR
jgi:dTDP-4-dehydrorhamnose 3,5-epimerase-like enzyme